MNMWKEREQAFVDELQDVIVKHCDGKLSPVQIIGALQLQVNLLCYEVESARNAKEAKRAQPPTGQGMPLSCAVVGCSVEGPHSHNEDCTCKQA